MTIQLKVSTIACDACAKTITKAIHNQHSQANVNVDVVKKIVTVETEASKESIQQAIEEAGHTVEL